MSNTSVQVVEIPESASSEDMERLLNERCTDGVFVMVVMPWGKGARAVLRKSIQVAPSKAAPKASADDLAMDFIRKHREMSIAHLRTGCLALGCKRGVQWVADRRAEVLKAERLKA